MLISIFIISVGLLGVASLIPAGKLRMVEANKSDRTGACGRAGLHEVKISGMLDTSVNTANQALTNLVDPVAPPGNGNWPGRVGWVTPLGGRGLLPSTRWAWQMA